MKLYLIGILLLFGLDSYAQQRAFGVGTNLTVSSFYHSFGIAPYAFYRHKKHHFGLGAMLGRKLAQKINSFGSLGSNTLTYDNDYNAAGIQAHYRYFIYPPQDFFDVFLEGYASNTFITQRVNGERGNTGSAFQLMAGIGFKLKLNDYIALTQTTLVGGQFVKLPSSEFEFSPIEDPSVAIGITLGVEFNIFNID